jgi:hypothetical protein
VVAVVDRDRGSSRGEARAMPIGSTLFVATGSTWRCTSPTSSETAWLTLIAEAAFAGSGATRCSSKAI